MRSILILVVSLFCIPAFGQNTKPASILTKAYADAEQQNKLILLVIGPRTPISDTRGKDYVKTLNNAEVKKKLSSDFNLIFGDYADSGVRSLISRYTITNFPAFLFLNAKGTLIFKDYGSSTSSQKYVSMIDRALGEAKKPSLTDYEMQHAAKRTDIVFLREFIDKRKSMGIMTNGGLIEDYVKLLTVKDLSDYQTVLYILEAGPSSAGQAYKMAYSNKKITDSIYKTEPLAKRIAINNLIIRNTMAQAIQLKNASLAQSAATFAAQTNYPNYAKANQVRNENMLAYYSGIKDTSSYLRTALMHYETYMKISSDSIKKLDKQSMEEARKLHESKALTGIKQPDSASAQRLKASLTSKTLQHNGYNQIMSAPYSVQTISNTLNNAASRVYGTGTRNSEYLGKALLWVKRAIELQDVYGYYSTQAHILYRLGYFHEAENSQLLSIEKAKMKNMKYDYLERDYKKIKERSL